MNTHLRSRLAALAVVAACAVFPAAAQQHPNVQKGFAPERAYQMGDVDHVNSFNGNLIVQIPVGGRYPVGGNLAYNLTLTHNSKLWDYQKVIRTFPTTGTYLRPIPSRRSNSGFGWLLSLGRILLPDNPINDGGAVVYESPDGSEHVIYPTLHEGEPPPPQILGTNYIQGYTRDGTYLRMRSLANGDAEIEFPDGNVHLFREIGITGLMRPIGLRDRYGNTLTIAYSTDNLTWTLTDSHNRQHKVYFKTISGQTQDNYKTAVDRVELASFNGGRATYQFQYNAQSISRACVPTGSTVDPQAGSSTSIPMLTSVRLPTGETWDFNYYTSHNACGQGSISQLTAPTGARFAYDYQLYRLPAAGCNQEAFNESPGIRQRIMVNAAQNQSATWTYQTEVSTNFSTTGWGCAAGTPRIYPHAPSEELKNTITKPNGDRITHYFSIWPQRLTSGGGFKRDDYGLPFTRRQVIGDRFLSTVASGNGKQTSTYVKYEVDGDPDFIEPLAPLNVDKNRRVAGSRTVYDDGKFADVAHTNFDGLGNHRTSTTSGSFASANARTTTTTFNPSVGEYRVDASGKAVPGYNPLSHGATWILGTFTSRTVTEGSSTLKSEYCFDGGTGFLSGRRTMKGTSGSPNDVVVVNGHTSGNVTSERFFGGDVNPTSSSGCGASGTAKYELSNEYQFGSLRRSKHVGMPFFDVDNDIDLNTGLVATSRDSAGISTTFQYDPLGRITSAVPQSGQGARISYVYSKDHTSATVDVTTRSNDGARTLDRKFFRFDSVGRPWLEFQLMPTGSWSVKETRYDTLGRVIRESQREAFNGSPSSIASPVNATTRTYDYLGRELIVTPPDGDRHRVDYSYSGISQSTETMRVGDGTSERTVSVTREFDRQGRLYRVSEPSGPTGGTVTTTYEHDAGDRLRKVTMSGSEATQTRTFVYDGRGFLDEERHPEFDNNAIDFDDYDALGHAGRKTGGGSGGGIIIPGLPSQPQSNPFDLSFTYDAGERLTHVRNLGTLVKEFVYDSKGKLQTAKRFQTVEGIGSVPVTETYVYNGIGGRLSEKTTTVGTMGSFKQGYTYTDLGQELTVAYPNCLHVGCKEASPARTITNAFSSSNSWLTAVNGYAPSISYHANAQVNEITHSNGVTDTQGLDPNMIPRPANITFKGWTQPPPCTKPAITTQPPTTVGAPDKATITLTVVATGSAPLRYQWYTGTAGVTTSPIAGADEASYVVTIPFRQNTLWVQVSNACGSVNSVTVTVKTCPLTITKQPEAKVVAKNDAATFSVTAGSAQGTVTYQWYEGASGVTTNPITPGGTSSTLTIQKAQQDALYWVRVKDTCSQVDSEAAKLIVGSSCLPVITKHPQDAKVIIPDFTTLRVEATITTPEKNLTWQWYEGEKGDISKPLNGAAGPQVSVRPSKSTRYWVRVAAKCGSVDSESALVCVLPNVSINPFSQTVSSNQVVTLSFQHGNTSSPVTYQWYEGPVGDTTTPVTGETEKSITITAAFTSFYWARISNDCGFNDTSAAKICVLPLITTQPKATTRQAGSNVTLSVQASGVGLVYQWYEGSAGDTSRPITGATASTVEVAPSATTNYWVAVSNECGVTRSATAQVKYCEPPVVTLHPTGGSLSPGQGITLKSNFTGTDLTYRWYANGSAISFGTNKDLFIVPAFSTSYYCEATNGCGTARTQSALVTVCGPPFVMQQPAASTYVPPGTTGTISVVVGGTIPIYKWYEGVTGDTSKPVPNGNGSAITVPSRTTSYWVHMTTACGEASSITAHVKACAAPTFFASSSSYFITQGQNITLKLNNLVNGPVTVTWYDGQTVGDTSRPVANGESVQLQPQQTTHYWVRVSNGCTSIDQNIGKIDVCVPGRILQEPANETTISSGQSATLNAVVRGSFAQWTWFEGQPGDTRKEVGLGLMNGTGNVSIVVKPASNKQYWLRVGNSCGSDSASATVYVTSCAVPTVARQPESAIIDIGKSAWLSVGASSASNHQWYIGQTGDETKPIAGATFSTLVVSPTVSTRYWAKAWNHCGETESASALITVRGSCNPPLITEQPYFATTTPGVPVQVSIGYLAGSASATVQWFTLDGQPVPGATSGTVSVSPVVNTIYYAEVESACGKAVSTNAVVNVASTCIPPTITDQPLPPPSGAYTMSGQPVTLWIRASGTGLTYQWYNDMPGGGLISGATNRTFEVAPIATALFQDLYYHVTVKNACGSVNGWATKVQAVPSCGPPKFTRQPLSKTIDPGQGAVLSIFAEGPAPINYEWYTLDGQRVPNTFGSTESIMVNPSRTTSYFVIARNGCGFDYSDTATITVNAACASPIITEHPRSPSIIAGQAVTLNANANGTAPVTWQWFNGDGSPIQGATSDSYTVTPTQSANYYAIASNACGTAKTNNGLVLVTCNQPSITSHPQSITINAGTSTTLTALVNPGSLPASLQWYTADGTALPGQTTGSLTVTPAATTTYYMQAVSACGTARTQNATVTVCQPATITAQPQDVSVDVGQIANMSVTATGTAPLSYQWYTGSGQPLSGQFVNGPGLSIGPTQAGTLTYFVRITNPCGTIQSRTVTVTVSCPKPTVIQQPQDATITQGESTTLSTTFTTGNLSHSIAWYTAAGTKVGEGSQITVSPTTTTGYYAVITNQCGPTNTNTATVTVNPCPNPVITTQPQNVIYTAGQASVTLSVTAANQHGPLTYQWYRAGNPVAGGTSATLVVSPPPTFTTEFYVVITNACGNQTTSNTVNVCSPATVMTEPQDVTIDRGQIGSLSVVAGGTGPFSYQWYTASGVPLSGQFVNGPSLSVGAESTVSYFVRITNPCGTVQSRTATITVNCPLPVITQQPQSVSITQGESTPLSVNFTVGQMSHSVAWYNAATGALVGEGQQISVSPQTTTSYYVIVRNPCGPTQSNTITVTVGPPCPKPLITQQPQSVSINAGQQATLSVSASSSTALSYQWFDGTNTPVPNGTNAALIVAPSVTTSYYVVITNACGPTTSSLATVSVQCPTPAITAQPQSVSITTGQSATLTVSATGTGLSYQWYRGAAGDNSNPIAGGTSPSVVVSPTTTTSYHVVVSNACGSANSSTAIVSVGACSTPAITQQPQSVSINTGQSATLTVGATGSGLSYQWYRGLAGDTTNPVAGGTSASVVVNPTTTTSYHVRVTNSCGTTTSSTATVTVQCPVPTITQQPQSVVITSGQSATLTVGASGTGLTYQWYRGAAGDTSNPVAGGTSPSVVVNPTTTTSYYVRVTNSCGSVNSSTATVTVQCPVPTITQQPQSVSITAGQSATLTVSASGSGLSYQWYRGAAGDTTNPVAGGTSPSVVVNPTTTTSYYVRVTNSCGSVNSSTATVTVTCTLPTITQQPQSTTITAGASATLSVTATGTGLTYQWFTSNGSPISGATSSTRTVSPASTTSYYVVVTNSCGSRTSSTATVTVQTCSDPFITQQPQSTSIDPGESATLSVSVSSDSAVSYEWYTSFGSHAGNGASISVSPSSTTSYYVIVTNNCGSVSSNFATVTVICNAPNITSNPSNETINEGQTATLSVSATGTAPLSYEWQQNVNGNWVSAGGGTSINVSGPAGTYTYRAVVSNACGQDISSPATVTINTVCVPPSITQQPVGPVFTEIWQSANVSVGATGSNLTYTWYYGSGFDIGTGPSITIHAQTSTVTYYVVVSNACGTVTSQSFTVQGVCKLPDVDIISVSDPVVPPGGSSVLHVNSSGTPLLDWTLYQQPVGGGASAISSGRGQNVPNATVVPPSTSDYWYETTNECGTTSSNVVRITVQ